MAVKKWLLSLSNNTEVWAYTLRHILYIPYITKVFISVTKLFKWLMSFSFHKMQHGKCSYNHWCLLSHQLLHDNISRGMFHKNFAPFNHADKQNRFKALTGMQQKYKAVFTLLECRLGGGSLAYLCTPSLGSTS